MQWFASIGKLLPRMIPLGVLTIAVVIAWTRFYGVIAEAVCTASAALGAGQCSAGTAPDPQALLTSVTGANGNGPGDQLCTVMASLPGAAPEGCEGSAAQEQCRQRRANACDPTKWMQLGPRSPGLSNCAVEPTTDKLPYEFAVTPRPNRTPACNVTKIRVEASGLVTFCFEEVRLKVKTGWPGKLALGQQYVNANPGTYCERGQLEAYYMPAGGHSDATSIVDLTRYGVKNTSGTTEAVVVPVTVSGAGRSNSDDKIDFMHSRRALAVSRWRQRGTQTPTEEQISSEAGLIEKEYDNKGFTWHHADLLRGADNRYYYRMILVPSAVHDTTPHDGGSTWARSRGISQTAGSWDAKLRPAGLASVLSPGWQSAASREPPEECQPCTEG